MIFLFFVALLQVSVIKASYFDTLVNADAEISASQYSLLSKEKSFSKFMCLAECIKRSDCLTVAYHRTDLNCFLYRDQFGSTDILPSTNSNLFFKKSSKMT